MPATTTYDKGEKNMAKAKNFNEVVLEKKATLDILEELMSKLNDLEEYKLTRNEETGEEQGKDWEGHLLWLDENGKRTTEETGTPYMRTTYKTVRLTADEMDEREKAYASALETIRDTLATLA